MNFRFAPGARLDLFDLVDWYEARAAGTGARLATEFDATLSRVRAQPHSYSRIRRTLQGREIRQARVTPFLVVMTYEVTATEVVILSVTHARSARQPWRRRLP